MRITNNQNLPAPLVAAIANDPYDRGDCDCSVTQLLRPPRMVQLEREHREDITEDASDRIWALMGQLGHKVLERSSQCEITEKRLYADVLGWRVSGQIDLLDGVLVDYKFTSSWSCIDGVKPEWLRQLNMLAWLCSQQTPPIPVRGLKIVAIYRDWSKLEAKRNAGYPQAQVQVFNVAMWTPEAAQAYMENCVRAHQSTRANGADCAECDESERWEKPTTWAVIKNGNKRAIPGGICNSLNQATELSLAKGIDKHHVEERKGEWVRCENYCSVAQWCSQFQAYKAQQPQPESTEQLVPA